MLQISSPGNDPSPPAGPGLIGVDWGTSSARSYLLDRAGRILETGPAGRGVLAVTEETGGSAAARGRAFEQELETMCGRWLDEHPSLPVLAAGMVGSNQGWTDVPYQRLPADLTSLARSMVEVRAERTRLHVVPGLLGDGALPEVMRGEETQILGALEAVPDGDVGEAAAEQVVVLPGTHTKWVTVRERTVTDFTTAMTGELYGLVTRYSILARGASGGGGSATEAFDRGVETSVATGAETGLLATLFSARTLPLTGRLAPESVNDYVSGLMIGAEVAGLLRHPTVGRLASDPSIPVLLCGEPDLCRRYQRALEHVSIGAAIVPEGSTARGLARMAVDAGLVELPKEERA